MTFASQAGLAQRLARGLGLKYAAQIEGFNNLRYQTAPWLFPKLCLTTRELDLLLGAQLVALQGNTLDACAELVAFKIGCGNRQHGSKSRKTNKRRDQYFDLEEVLDKV